MNNIVFKAINPTSYVFRAISNIPISKTRLFEQMEVFPVDEFLLTSYETGFTVRINYDMVEFKELDDKVTVGNKYKTAMMVETQEEADAYFKVLVRHCMRFSELAGKPLTVEEAEVIEKDNIGYFSGYYGTEVQSRLFEFYDTEHPLFGRSSPTPEQALKAGEMMAEGLQAGRNISEVTADIRKEIGVDSAHEYFARKQELKKKTE